MYVRLSPGLLCKLFFFFFNDTATTEIYTLSLHDALPISADTPGSVQSGADRPDQCRRRRSEEHTSELQSHVNIVCRLLLEKKKKKHYILKMFIPKEMASSIHKSVSRR